MFCICLMFQRVLQIKTHVWEKVPLVLVGNKCDMEDERVVDSVQGSKLANELGSYV